MVAMVGMSLLASPLLEGVPCKGIDSSYSVDKDVVQTLQSSSRTGVDDAHKHALVVGRGRRLSDRLGIGLDLRVATCKGTHV